MHKYPHCTVLKKRRSYCFNLRKPLIHGFYLQGATHVLCVSMWRYKTLFFDQPTLLIYIQLRSVINTPL